MSKKVSVLITNLNSFNYLRTCVDYFLSDTGDLKVHEILVLELGDEDISGWVRTRKLPIKVFKKKMPCYFAESYNFLASKATGDTLLFLNPDIEPGENFVKELVGGLSKYDIVGAKLVYPTFDDRLSPSLFGRIQHVGIDWKDKYPSTVSMPQHPHIGEAPVRFKTNRKVKAVTGAVMMLKKTTWDKLEGFDTDFINCFEDVDLCIRAIDAGMKVGVVCKTEAIHYVNGSGGTSGKTRTSFEFKEHSTDILLQKYSGKPKATRTVYGPKETKGPIKQIRQIKVDSNDPGYINRILIATPTQGLVRMEWVLARHGQVIPMNWSMVQYAQFMSSFVPLRYSVPDAQNLIVQEAIKGDFEWVLFLEDDTMPPPDAFIRFNKYMREGKVPIISGLYFSRSQPSEPLVFRGRGTSVYWDWKFGDKVWVDGVPTGMLLVHMSIMKALYKESPEYNVGGSGMRARKVFAKPQKMWVTPEGHFNTLSGTTDLEWCTRVMDEGIFEKAGWPEYQRKQHPFLVDTGIFCFHIDRHTGVQYPPDKVLKGF